MTTRLSRETMVAAWTQHRDQVPSVAAAARLIGVQPGTLQQALARERAERAASGLDTSDLHPGAPSGRACLDKRGTVTGYRRHRRAQESACFQCRAAKAQDATVWRDAMTDTARVAEQEKARSRMAALRTSRRSGVNREPAMRCRMERADELDPPGGTR